MSITSIEIDKSLINETGLVSIHNQLTFLCDVEYSITAPEYVNVTLSYLVNETYIDLGTFKAIYYKDIISGTQRQYVFEATTVLKAFMEYYEDFDTPFNIFHRVENIQKNYKLTFFVDAISDEVEFNAVHCSTEYGTLASLSKIYNNETELYISGEDMPVYVYYYMQEDGEELDIDIDGEEVSNDYALDDDNIVFWDDDFYLFRI